jgi:hypothetical protein
MADSQGSARGWQETRKSAVTVFFRVLAAAIPIGVAFYIALGSVYAAAASAALDRAVEIKR